MEKIFNTNILIISFFILAFIVGVFLVLHKYIKKKKKLEQEIAFAKENFVQIKEKENNFIDSIEQMKTDGFICGTMIYAFKQEWQETYQELKKLNFNINTETGKIANSVIYRYENIEK